MSVWKLEGSSTFGIVVSYMLGSSAKQARPCLGYTHYSTAGLIASVCVGGGGTEAGKIDQRF